MMSTPGSGKWVFAVCIAILLVVGWAFPQGTLFVLKFVKDLIVLNLQAFYDYLIHLVPSHAGKFLP